MYIFVYVYVTLKRERETSLQKIELINSLVSDNMITCTVVLPNIISNIPDADIMNDVYKTISYVRSDATNHIFTFLSLPFQDYLNSPRLFVRTRLLCNPCLDRRGAVDPDDRNRLIMTDHN